MSGSSNMIHTSGTLAGETETVKEVHTTTDEQAETKRKVKEEEAEQKARSEQSLTTDFQKFIKRIVNHKKKINEILENNDPFLKLIKKLEILKIQKSEKIKILLCGAILKSIEDGNNDVNGLFLLNSSLRSLLEPTTFFIHDDDINNAKNLSLPRNIGKIESNDKDKLKLIYFLHNVDVNMRDSQGSIEDIGHINSEEEAPPGSPVASEPKSLASSPPPLVSVQKLSLPSLPPQLPPLPSESSELGSDEGVNDAGSVTTGQSGITYLTSEN